jgi:phage repressor protein C with HTH and peptisase S24 domain
MFTQYATSCETTPCLLGVASATMKSDYERLLDAAREKFPGVVETPSDLGRLIDESSQSLTNWKSRGLPKSKITKLAKIVGVSPDWLESGEGEPGKVAGSVNATIQPIIPAGASIKAYETLDELDPASYVLVNRYDVQLSAGCGNIQWVVHEEDPISFRARWFQHKRIKPENCKALFVRGRSMEPKLEDWDTVLIDTSNREIVDGDVYAVCLDDQFYIKAVHRKPGMVVLRSYNRDFEDIEVVGEQMNELCIIGKMVWRGG